LTSPALACWTRRRSSAATAGSKALPGCCCCSGGMPFPPCDAVRSVEPVCQEHGFRQQGALRVESLRQGLHLFQSGTIRGEGRESGLTVLTPAGVQLGGDAPEGAA